MASGLIAGMGNSLLFSILMCVMMVLVSILLAYFGKKDRSHMELRIIIPEEKYTSSFEMFRVKSTNLGSLFRIHYHIVMIESGKEKEMLDEIRCQNGNFEVMISHRDTEKTEL